MHQKPRDVSAPDSHFFQVASSIAESGLETAAPSAVTFNSLDDVFGSQQDARPPAQEPTHPTDMGRLQAQHGTSGYREGVSVSREASIQSGFDEGFSLGAAIGQQAGQMLGLLQGICSALAPSPLDHHPQSAAETLLNQAREELSSRHIFSPDYWAPDGNWTFEVKPKDDETEVVFRDVAEAHPLIRKWAAIVDAQVQLWKLKLDILSHETAPRVDVIGEEQTKIALVQKVNKALDW